jgi:hypothetical protein
MKSKRPPSPPYQLLSMAGLGSEAPQGAAKADPATAGPLAPLPGEVTDLIKEADSYVGGIIRSRPGQQKDAKGRATPGAIPTNTTQPPPDGWLIPKKMGEF